MGKQIKIGQTTFKFKKDAILHYRTILNSYNFDESLNDKDFDDLIDLLDYAYLNDLSDDNSEEDSFVVENKDMVVEDETDDLEIVDIKIARVQFNTKCFEVFFNDNTSEYISYLMILNNKSHSPESLFSAACRSATHDDIRSVKLAYFAENSIKGVVKCQETGILSNWTDLVVDHRQPNTFSMIVERFKEIHNIDLDKIEYTNNEKNHIIFKNEQLSAQFRAYHKEKAVLRVVRKGCNASRTNMAIIKKTSKDLTIQ